MNPAAAAWFTRIGMFVEFVSFWLMVPELLGENRLRALEGRLEQGLHRLLGNLVFAVGVVSVVTLLIGLIVVEPFYIQSFERFTQKLGYGTILLVLVLVGVAGALSFVLFFRVAVEIGFILEKLSRRLLAYMADDENLRQRTLIGGATFFVIGTALQLIGTI